MSVSCQSVISILERIAPRQLAEEWDSGIGLQIGDPAQQVNKVFLALDLDISVLQEAKAQKADMLVVHHTPFFKPLKNLRTDMPNGRLITEIVKSGMALYTLHTNLDAVSGGVNDVLAGKLKLQDVSVLSPGWKQKLYKLVVYIPRDYSEQVRSAISKAGAGWIGNYSDCTFQVNGIGTFKPQENTNPFIGTPGKLETVDEIRLETIVLQERISSVVKAMIKAHPYEEVAYDLYLLANEAKVAGLGRIGRLSEPVSLEKFILMVKENLGIDRLRYCGEKERRIEKVAVCGGSGMSYWHEAFFAGAQVFLTSDIKYHEAQDALANNLALVDAGHFATEQPVMPVLAELLRMELLQKNIEIAVSQISTDPFNYL